MEEEKKTKTLSGQSAWNRLQIDPEQCPNCSINQFISYQDQDALHSKPSKKSKKEAARKLKLDMEENLFCYIPPRVKVKRKGYLHYARRNMYLYAVHADYYIVLRSCAKVAQVETRIMHIAVLSFERRLERLEKRMEYSFDVKPNLNKV